MRSCDRLTCNQADRIQTPKALCNRPVSDNQEDQIQFQRPKALCVQTPFALIEPGGRSTSNSERPSTLCWQHHRRGAPSPRGVTHFGARSARPAPPASSLARASSRASLCIDLSMCVSRDALSDERRHRSLSPRLDLLEPVRGELCQPLSARTNGYTAIVSLDLQQ